MSEVRATPLVAAQARRYGVDLGRVTATGVGGRISLADVRAAVVDWAVDTGRIGASRAAFWRQQAHAGVDVAAALAAMPEGIAAGVEASTRVAAALVPADAESMSRNPLVDRLRRDRPDLYRLAAAAGPAPTMFVSGDLPPFTASGIDPALLLKVPARARHILAAEPERGRALALIEELAGEDIGVDDDMRSYEGRGEAREAWRAYEARVRTWSSATAELASEYLFGGR